MEAERVKKMDNVKILEALQVTSSQDSLQREVVLNVDHFGDVRQQSQSSAMREIQLHI